MQSHILLLQTTLANQLQLFSILWLLNATLFQPLLQHRKLYFLNSHLRKVTKDPDLVMITSRFLMLHRRKSAGSMIKCFPNAKSMVNAFLVSARLIHTLIFLCLLRWCLLLHDHWAEALWNSCIVFWQSRWSFCTRTIGYSWYFTQTKVYQSWILSYIATCMIDALWTNWIKIHARRSVLGSHYHFLTSFSLLVWVCTLLKSWIQKSSLKNFSSISRNRGLKEGFFFQIHPFSSNEPNLLSSNMWLIFK